MTNTVIYVIHPGEWIGEEAMRMANVAADHINRNGGDVEVVEVIGEDLEVIVGERAFGLSELELILNDLKKKSCQTLVG